MTEALSENLIALLRAFTGISNLAITNPVRMPDAKENEVKKIEMYQIDTCHDHARETLQEGEEDDDRTPFVDVPSSVPDAITIE